MGNVRLGFKQIYGGIKTIFRRETKNAAKATANQAPVYHGPTMSEIIRQQPLALPAPTAEQLAADVPQVVVPKVLEGKNLNELRMSQEILSDGSHVRYYRAPESNRILIKTKDKGRLHQEWVNRNNGFLYIKSTGDGSRYVLNKDGNFIQIEQRSVKYKDGINQTISTNDIYYSDHNGSGVHLHRENGFNGEKKAYGGVISTVPGRRWDENKFVPAEVEYGAKIREPYINETRIIEEESTSTNRPSIHEIYTKQGCDEGNNAYIRAKELTKMTKEKFIKDIDEAFFNPYKA